jgi:CRISPR-associated endonuclease/helicase Cas3
VRPEDFDNFYQAVHDYPPFHWQSMLALKVASEGKWPEVLKLPTSSGKTSVIDIAIFHLALEAELSASARKAHLRTFFVVDRRIVVDEAEQHAKKLANKLIEALDKSESGIVRDVAHRLREFGGPLPLQVAVLRGGMYRDTTWADMPNQPLVCLSTVDQVGSRLLFRGYQVSEGQAPVHAGLVANDSLLILDEAHLSTPFVDTLNAVVNYQGWGEQKMGRPLLCVQMSATARSSETPFVLDYDKEPDVLKRRLDASKLAELHEAGKFEDEAAKHARNLATKPGVSVVGVVVNTVAAARKIFQQFKQGEAILLTGRIRPWDRDQILNGKKYWDRIRAGRTRSDEKLFVVATQTVEVGANLDFDGLVTEAAPLDSLQQRFGRLDRMGYHGSTSAVILLRKESKPNPIYGGFLQDTWKWMKQNATANRIDFGVRALNRLQPPQEGLNTERERGPLLFPAHIETWVQTNPLPSPDPDVAPFLHGKNALDAADVQIVWRADLNEENKKNWVDIVSLAPPVVMEALPVPIAAARRWLEQETAAAVSDLEGIGVTDDEPGGKRSRPVLIWRGPEKSEAPSERRRVRPGETIVIPATYGGADHWGWNPDSTEAVPDIGNDCSLSAEVTRRVHLRLHPDVPIPVTFTDSQELIESLKNYLAGEDDEQRREYALAIRRAIDLVHPGIRSLFKPYDNERGLSFTWKLKREVKRPRLEMTPDETDDTDEASLTRTVPIKKHLEGVRKHVARFAQMCGLPAPLIADLELAASLHDLGKWDSRFQYWVLRNGSSDILAKSDIDNPGVDFRRSLLEGHYPQGARHEVTSVALLKDSALLVGAHDRELVLHLIGTHHGHGRPFTPVWSDGTVDYRVAAEYNGTRLESSSGYEQAQLGSGWTERFWLLNQKYGYWGLAYLEAILRRADCVESRREEDEK